MQRKLISLLLAPLLLAGTFASCSEQPSEAGDSSAPAVSGDAAEAASEETVPEETELQPDLPDVTLDGYAFRVLTRDTDHHIKEVYAAELNGEVVNDAVYARNLNVEEKYNMKLEAVEVTESPETVC